MIYKILGKGKISVYDLLFIIMVITPFIDTINGAFVRNYGETGTSIGTFYRMAILVFVFVFIRIKREYFKWILVLSYFPVSSAIRAGLEGLPFMSAFSYGFKWLFPVILISGFLSIFKTSKRNVSLELITVWKYLIPSILVFEYIFKIGDAAYPEAGWRGLFYCNNDIAFSLTVMSIISLYEFIIVKTNVKNLIPLGLNALAILILSTKSSLIFFVLTGFYFICKKFKRKPQSTILIIIFVAILVSIALYLMRDSVEGILNRYGQYYYVAMQNPSFANFMNFLTSSRTPRIAGKFDMLSADFTLTGSLFGWIVPINNYAIEMDWFDALFQHGIIGLFLLISYYSRLLIHKYKNYMFKYAIFIALVCSFFSGHVINGALPSTVFSVLVGFILSENMKLKGDLYDKENN